MNVVIVNARSMMPLNGGDKVFSLGLWKVLQEVANVTYVLIEDEPMQGNYPQEWQEAIASKKLIIWKEDVKVGLFKSLIGFILSQPYFYFRRKNRKKYTIALGHLLEKIKPDYVVYDHLRSLSYLPNGSYANILIQHNNEVLIYKQKTETLHWAIRWLAYLQVNALHKFELKMQAFLQRQVFLSVNDIQEYHSNSVALSNIYIPLQSQIQIQPKVVQTGTHALKVLFVGALDWLPNKEGLQWFLYEVLPHVSKPMHITIVGRNAKSVSIANKIGKHAIDVYENVPSIVNYYKSTDLVIVPILQGSGINIKLLEAASYGIPIVCSEFSLKGNQSLGFLPASNDALIFAQNLLEYISIDKRQYISELLKIWQQNIMNYAVVEWQRLLTNHSNI